MEQVKAQLNDFRISPRKMRTVANSIRGKGVTEALISLRFLSKRGANPLQKLLKSAVANAKSHNLEGKNLIVKEIKVDGGKILYRRRSASRGRAPVIRKRTSHISLVLQEKKTEPRDSKNETKSKIKQSKS